MGIDKAIYHEEVQFCFELGIKMGLNTNAIGEVLRKIVRKPEYILQRDEFEKIFRKYSN
jgi:2-phosphoglycerate kinase